MGGGPRTVSFYRERRAVTAAEKCAFAVGERLESRDGIRKIKGQVCWRWWPKGDGGRELGACPVAKNAPLPAEIRF